MLYNNRAAAKAKQVGPLIDFPQDLPIFKNKWIFFLHSYIG
jgi:hypothetical protein